MGNLTKKQLEALVEDLRRDVQSLNIARMQADDELQAARGTIQEQLEALTTARTQVTAAEEAAANTRRQASVADGTRGQIEVQLHQALTTLQALQTAQAANAPLAAEAAAVSLPEIAQPSGTGWSIRKAMDLDHADYAEIQRTVRNLVIRSQLDWTEDFRRQDADKLATMFRAAYPVLRRYLNNWATAAIARQYMQNKRKHAYKQGYIKKKPNAADQNHQRRDDDDTMGGAGSGYGLGVGAA